MPGCPVCLSNREPDDPCDCFVYDGDGEGVLTREGARELAERISRVERAFPIPASAGVHRLPEPIRSPGDPVTLLSEEGEAKEARVHAMNVLVDSKVMHGNPCILGTRVPVYNLAVYLAGGGTVEEFAEEYEVAEEDVRLALLFIADLLHGHLWRAIRLHVDLFGARDAEKT